MKTLIYIASLLLIVTSLSLSQGTYMRTGIAFSNVSLVDKAINVTLDSTSWMPFRWYDNQSGIWIFPDSMYILIRAKHTNGSSDSMATYVHVDFAPYSDTTGMRFSHPFFFRITVDSIKARTQTNTNQFQQWRIARVNIGAPFKAVKDSISNVLKHLGAFGIFRIVLSSTLHPEPYTAKPYTLTGNGTVAGIPKVWINWLMTGKGGK